MTTRINITTPAGRLISGSLYKGSDKDAEGKPRTIKTGPNAGQTATQWFFQLAIPKGPERGWWETEWGKLIYSVGAAAFPQACQSPTFAWKVKDGDSTIPNRRGKRPCDQEGAKGCWLLSFASGFPPKVYKDNGNTLLDQVDAVNLGDYVQVFGSVDGNGSQQQPGVFLNHSMVNFLAYGERIVSGPDATAVGFGQGVQLPAGASATPLAGSFNPAAPGGAAPMPGSPVGPGGAPYMPAPTMPAMPGAPSAMPPAMPGSAPSPQMGAPMAPAPAANPVMPHPGFLAGPGAPVAPPAPMAPPARQMTAKANGYTYEQLVAQGWNDQTLVQHGLMLA